MQQESKKISWNDLLFEGFLKFFCVLWMCLHQGAKKYAVEAPQGNKKYGLRLLKEQ